MVSAILWLSATYWETQDGADRKIDSLRGLANMFICTKHHSEILKIASGRGKTSRRSARSH